MKKMQSYRQFIAAIIRKLPSNQQLVLSLRYCDGLTFEEIGKVLDIPESQARRLFVQGKSKCIDSGQYLKLPLL